MKVLCKEQGGVSSGSSTRRDEAGKRNLSRRRETGHPDGPPRSDFNRCVSHRCDDRAAGIPWAVSDLAGLSDPGPVPRHPEAGP